MTAVERIRAFFEEALPAGIAHRPDLFDQTQATVSLFVQGAGAWTLRFGDHKSERAIAAEPTLEADLVLTFSLQRFLALLDGEPHDPPEASQILEKPAT